MVPVYSGIYRYVMPEDVDDARRRRHTRAHGRGGRARARTMRAFDVLPRARATPALERRLGGRRGESRRNPRDARVTVPRARRLARRAEGEGADGRGGKGFIGGLLVGGAVFGALGFLFAPQLSKTLLGGKRALSKALDEESEDELESTRRNLNEKIAALNSAIDNFSSEAESGIEKTVTKLGEELNGLSGSGEASPSAGPEAR